MPINVRDQLVKGFTGSDPLIADAVNALALTQPIQDLINATALSALQGTITDGQIPASIMRDAEFTAAAVRTLLALTSTEVNDLLTGATISGQVLTFTQNDGSTVGITYPHGAGGNWRWCGSIRRVQCKQSGTDLDPGQRRHGPDRRACRRSEPPGA